MRHELIWPSNRTFIKNKGTSLDYFRVNSKAYILAKHSIYAA